MTQDSKTPEDIRKLIEEVLPGFMDFVRTIENENEEDGTSEFVLNLFKEATTFQSEYPLISHLLMDALECLRCHEQRINFLKDVLKDTGVIIEEAPTPLDKRYIN